MERPLTNGSEAAPDLIVDIIEMLEAYGVDRYEYQLNDFIDVEALEQILDSSDGGVNVQFTVERIRLVVTPESVDVLNDKEPSPDP